jgi:hypothetical protein
MSPAESGGNIHKPGSADLRSGSRLSWRRIFRLKPEIGGQGTIPDLFSLFSWGILSTNLMGDIDLSIYSSCCWR